MDKKLLQFLADLKQYGIDNDIPNVTEKGGRYLNELVKEVGAKRILEIGTANGYSTIWMAEAVKQNGGRVTTIDFSEPTFAEAKENFKKTGFDSVIDMRFGNALSVLPTIKEPATFDFVFVDGQKAHYHDFWHLIQPRLAQKVTVVFDDVIAFAEKTAPLMATQKHIPHGNIHTTQKHTYHTETYIPHGNIHTTRKHTYYTETYIPCGNIYLT